MQNKYVYGTHDVPTPLSNPVIKKSVPYLHRVAQINDAGPDPSCSSVDDLYQFMPTGTTILSIISFGNCLVRSSFTSSR